MLVQLSKAFVAVAVSSALSLALGQAQDQQAQPAQGQQPAQQQAQPAQQQTQPGQAAAKNWKDRAEYDLVQQIGQATDGNKKLALLEQWTQKYPNTDFKVERMVQYLEAYRLLNQPQKMWETAKQIIAEDPKNITALYWTSLLVVSMGNTDPANLDFGEKAATTLANNLDDLKPAGVSDADWQKTKDAMKLHAVGHRALGFIAMTRKNYEEAEKQLTQNLQENPADAEAAYWLGTSILGQKKPERQSDALFYFARAAAYDGPGALDPNRRKVIMDYVTKAYEQYHGADPQGFQELLKVAKTNPAPPAGFKVLSDVEMKEKKHAEIAAQDPSLAFWLKLKDALMADPNYFGSGMKGALIPPEAEPSFRGTVISATPAKALKEVVLGISNATTPEVTLQLDTPLPGPADPGTVIRFRGIAENFQSQPFMLTFQTERKNIEGWPTPAPAAKKGARRTKKK